MDSIFSWRLIRESDLYASIYGSSVMGFPLRTYHDLNFNSNTIDEAVSVHNYTQITFAYV